ncbi:MAG: flagellar motor switch phosphatase FliY [Clostridiales bacterium]|jgi:flagellar motor switch protein FliN/FliY|nr:flagellar motor switch phosphatase FliY [Clostridiales bacterium]
MSDMLSQAEIEALLGEAGVGGATPNAAASDAATPSGGVTPGSEADHTSDETDAYDNSGPVTLPEDFTSEQKDILGEMGNITIGTAATTLYTLLNQKVLITTPTVKIMTWADVSRFYDKPCVGVRVDYKAGLVGSNIMLLKERDVRIISNLMMGGDGDVPENGELTELDLSAISEAMNQMIGSSSTSLSSMVGYLIDIDAPQAFVLDFADDEFFDVTGQRMDEPIVCVSFQMEIGTLIKSGLVQALPYDFALEVIETMGQHKETLTNEVINIASQPQAGDSPPEPPADKRQDQQTVSPQANYQPTYNTAPVQQNVNVQPAQFQNFDVGSLMQQKENIDIIMDVPLEVSVELGRTKKSIKEILEFSPGSVIELDKLAGEPIDILVNGKFVAKGEVVVIDENFGIRVTDIISVDKRI